MDKPILNRERWRMALGQKRGDQGVLDRQNSIAATQITPPRTASLATFGFTMTLMASLLCHTLTAEAVSSKAEMAQSEIAKTDVSTAAISDAVVPEAVLSRSELPTVTVPAFNHQGAPNTLIEQATNALLKELEVGNKLSESNQTVYFREAVELIVAPFIDFKTIARRVMAKNYRLANPQQRTDFLEAFRETLLVTYTKGMQGYSDETLKVLPFKGSKRNKKGIERASVDMEIHTKEGSVIPIIYQVYRNKEGDWRLDNMILNGVNLGLTFRNQFNEALRQAKGDIDKVIAEWNIPIDELQAKAEEG